MQTLEIKRSGTTIRKGDINKLATTTERYKLFNQEEMAAVVKIESELLRGARKYFEETNFTEVIVPHLTRATGACENVGTMFQMDYFGERSYLIQTGQLYLESLIPILGNVYCIGSSFRAEAAVDDRHLTEFTLLEIEFPGDLNQLLMHIENTINTMIKTVLENCREELLFLNVNIKRLENIKSMFHRITYTDTVKLLRNKGHKLHWGDDLKRKHEEDIVKHFNNEPVFVTHYPKAIKFFNMRTNNDNKEIVNSTDLLLPSAGEAVGAAEREYEHKELYEKLSTSKMLKQLEKRGGSIKDFDWYLKSMKIYGSAPHAGCGIGLNRVTKFVLGTEDIRTTTAFPMNRESLM